MLGTELGRSSVRRNDFRSSQGQRLVGGRLRSVPLLPLSVMLRIAILPVTVTGHVPVPVGAGTGTCTSMCKPCLSGLEIILYSVVPIPVPVPV